MKRILTIIFFLVTACCAISQDEVPIYFIEVGSTGCYFFSPTEEVEFEMSYSQDSAMVWTGSTSYDIYGYEIICVQFVESMYLGEEDLVLILESYMDYLQTAFEITSAFGYGHGHTSESNSGAQGVTDFWEDAAGDNWTVKGWIDNEYLAVMIVWGAEAPPSNLTSFYLDGFMFP